MRRFSPWTIIRTVVLLTAGIGAIVRARGYLNPPTTGMTSFIDGALPLTAWAVLWLVAGIIAIAGIWSHIAARWGLSIVAALWFTWFLSYMVAWIAGDSSRGWLTAGGFFVISIYSWIFVYVLERPGKLGEVWNG